MSKKKELTPKKRKMLVDATTSFGIWMATVISVSRQEPDGVHSPRSEQQMRRISSDLIAHVEVIMDTFE